VGRTKGEKNHAAGHILGGDGLDDLAENGPFVGQPAASRIAAGHFAAFRATMITPRERSVRRLS
jgi:hypothetical protein